MNTMTRCHVCAVALLLSAPLGACGIKGSLKTPPPVFGKTAPATVGDPDTTIIDTEEADDDEGPFYGPDFEDDFGEDD